MEKVQPNHFNRSGAFYPIVVNYLHQLIGMKELSIRAYFGDEPIDAKLKRLLGESQKTGSEEEYKKLQASVKKLCGPLQLRSEQHDTHIEIETELIAQDTAENFSYLSSYMLISAGQLLVVAFELIKESDHYEASPICEFLRHCRNGAAHGGKFNLRAHEPRRKAEWGKFIISSDLNESPLFRRPNGTGMLGIGDPIRLLWDIEQAHPNIGPCERVYGYLLEKEP